LLVLEEPGAPEQFVSLGRLTTVSGVVAIPAAQLAFVGYAIPVGFTAKNATGVGAGLGMGVGDGAGVGVAREFWTFSAITALAS